MTKNDKQVVRDLFLEFADRCRYHSCPLCNVEWNTGDAGHLPDRRGEVTYVCPRCKRRSLVCGKR